MLVEVTYALEKKQTLLELEVDEGTTLKQAIELSGIIDAYPQIDLTKEIIKIGLYEVKINLHAEILATIHIEVVKQEEKN